RDASYAFMRKESGPVTDANHKQYGVASIPMHVRIDRTGIIRLYQPGRMSEEELDGVIRKLLSLQKDRKDPLSDLTRAWSTSAPSPRLARNRPAVRRAFRNAPEPGRDRAPVPPRSHIDRADLWRGTSGRSRRVRESPAMSRAGGTRSAAVPSGPAPVSAR